MFSARPEVFAHNVETVPRIFKRIRPAFRYERSLDVITQGRDAGLITKSNLILGMGEERAEVCQALQDLHDAGTDIITITQYLRPSPRHLPVARWVRPEEFVELKEEAEQIGFLGVLAGPLVRSSLPRRSPVGPVDAREGPRDPRRARPPRRRLARVRPGGRLTRRASPPPVETRSEAAPPPVSLSPWHARKDKPSAPKEPGRMKQMWQVFQMTRRYDSSAQLATCSSGSSRRSLVGLGLALWLGEGNGFTIALWIVVGRARRRADRAASSSAAAPSAPPTRRSRASPAPSAPCCTAASAAAGSAARCPSP